MGYDVTAGVKKARKKCGLSQKELAERLGVTPSCISSYETGKALPSIEFYMHLSELADMSLEELLSFDEYSARVNQFIDDMVLNYRSSNKFDEAARQSDIKPTEAFALRYETLKKFREISESIF